MIWNSLIKIRKENGYFSESQSKLNIWTVNKSLRKHNSPDLYYCSVTCIYYVLDMVVLWFLFCRWVNWGTESQLASDRVRIWVPVFWTPCSHSLPQDTSLNHPSSQGNQCFLFHLLVAKLYKSVGLWPSQAAESRTGWQWVPQLCRCPSPGPAPWAYMHQWHI